jgi:hypothetical protein
MPIFMYVALGIGMAFATGQAFKGNIERRPAMAVESAADEASCTTDADCEAFSRLTGAPRDWTTEKFMSLDDDAYADAFCDRDLKATDDSTWVDFENIHAWCIEYAKEHGVDL